MNSVQIDPRQEGDLRSLLQVVSRLFECPIAGWNEDVVLAEYLDWLPDAEVGDVLRHFWNARQQLTIDELWLRYVDTFELADKATLYLTLSLYSNPLQRSLALQKLNEAYKGAGVALPVSELPDYLPAVLEYAAAAPMYEAAMVLHELRPGIAKLERILREMGSLYADVAKASLMLCDRVIQKGGGAYLQGRTGKVLQ